MPNPDRSDRLREILTEHRNATLTTAEALAMIEHARPTRFVPRSVSAQIAELRREIAKLRAERARDGRIGSADELGSVAD